MNTELNLSQIPLLIAYVVEQDKSKSGWRLTELLPNGVVERTPQAFEAEYGYLPSLKGIRNRQLKRKKKEYYAHRKVNKKPSI